MVHGTWDMGWGRPNTGQGADMGHGIGDMSHATLGHGIWDMGEATRAMQHCDKGNGVGGTGHGSDILGTRTMWQGGWNMGYMGHEPCNIGIWDVSQAGTWDTVMEQEVMREGDVRRDTRHGACHREHAIGNMGRSVCSRAETLQ